MKKSLFNPMDGLLVILGLYSVTTLTQTLFPFSMNRLVVAGSILMLVYACGKRAGKLDWFFAGYLCLFGLYTLCIAKNKSVNVMDFIYYFTAFLQLLYFSKEASWEELGDSARRLDRFLEIIAAVDLGILVISLLWPGCHRLHEYWGDKTYFFGFTNSVHTLASSVCLAMSLMVLCLSKRKFSVVHLPILAIYAYAVLDSGARVFLIPVLLLLFVYIQNRITNKRLLWALYGVGIPLVVVGLLFSGFGQKILDQIVTSEKKGISLLTALTSGRNNLWATDIADFLQNRPVFQLLGNGFDYVYVLNYSPITNSGIGAHNDFINILISAGVLGLVLYVYLLIVFLRAACKKQGFINSAVLVIYVVFPAFINGFYCYYHYFSSFMLLVLALKYLSAQKAISGQDA